MLHSLIAGLFVLVVLPLNILAGEAYIDFDNDFVDPSYILAKKFKSSTLGAQTTVTEYADFLAAQGPWCKHAQTRTNIRMI